MICLWSKAGLSGLPLRGTCVSVLAATQAVGDERHYMFDCPAFQGNRAYYDSSMQLFMWHRDQKAVSGCLSAILSDAQNINTDPSS